MLTAGVKWGDATLEHFGTHYYCGIYYQQTHLYLITPPVFNVMSNVAMTHDCMSPSPIILLYATIVRVPILFLTCTSCNFYSEIFKGIRIIIIIPPDQ